MENIHLMFIQEEQARLTAEEEAANIAEEARLAAEAAGAYPEEDIDTGDDDVLNPAYVPPEEEEEEEEEDEGEPEEEVKYLDGI